MRFASLFTGIGGFDVALEGAGMVLDSRYRMLGNAVAVPCVQWIGERIMEVEHA